MSPDELFAADYDRRTRTGVLAYLDGRHVRQLTQAEAQSITDAGADAHHQTGCCRDCGVRLDSPRGRYCKEHARVRHNESVARYHRRVLEQMTDEQRREFHAKKWSARKPGGRQGCDRISTA